MINNFMINQNSIWAKEDQSIVAMMMRNLSHSVEDKIGLRNWRFILEDQKNGEDEPHFILDFESFDIVGGNCAFDKIETLRNHPEVATTQDLKNSHALMDNEVSWYGGINIPYTGYEDLDPKTIFELGHKDNMTKGMIRIAFSGAKESIDQIIAIEMLFAYMKACDTLIPEAAYFYDLSGLKEDQLSARLLR